MRKYTGKIIVECGGLAYRYRQQGRWREGAIPPWNVRDEQKDIGERGEWVQIFKYPPFCVKLSYLTTLRYIQIIIVELYHKAKVRH